MQCYKIKFDEIGAMLALAEKVRKGKGEKRYYYCKQCRAYHLTSKEKTV